jgi:hypothetical protein
MQAIKARIDKYNVLTTKWMKKSLKKDWKKVSFYVKGRTLAL